MTKRNIAPPVMSVAVIAALSACTGTGGGGAGGGGGGNDAYETAFDAASAIAPTSDMPTSLNATFAGQMKVGVNSGTTDLLGTTINPQNAEIIGDVDLDVAWTNNMTGSPLTGTATNFVATEAGTTNSVMLDGTLTVDNLQPATISRVDIPSQTIAGQTIPAIQTGAFSFTMAGEISHGNEAGDVNLLLGGSFLGSGATAMTGAVSGGINDVNNPTPQIFDAGIGGTFYANRE